MSKRGPLVDSRCSWFVVGAARLRWALQRDIHDEGRFRGCSASFAFVAAFPIEADAVVACLAGPLTVLACRLLFSALNLPVLAGPISRQLKEFY